MKKTISLLCCVSLIAFSCSSDKEYYDPAKIIEQKEAQYAAGFVQKYGQIADDQDWGFGEKKNTRAANPNSNQWADFTEVPGEITGDEIEKVTKWFSENPNPSSINVNWTDFFVQHVSISHANMEYLHTLLENGAIDHVNNFNANAGSIMLMQNSSTSSFGYRSSQDNGLHYNYTVQYIDGAYYVGFDYEATGQNPNQQEPADGYYNDWIIKVCPAIYKDAKRIIAEDLGDSDDFDFNDVVFDAALLYDATVITVQAAGGTLPLYIEVGGEKREVHEAFGVAESVMVNTRSDKKAPAMFRLPKCNSIDDVKVLVTDKAASYYLSAECGKAPQKICVPITYEWTTERQSIEEKYPLFNEWVSNPDVEWLGK